MSTRDFELLAALPDAWKTARIMARGRDYWDADARAAHLAQLEIVGEAVERFQELTVSLLTAPLEYDPAMSEEALRTWAAGVVEVLTK